MSLHPQCMQEWVKQNTCKNEEGMKVRKTVKCQINACKFTWPQLNILGRRKNVLFCCLGWLELAFVEGLDFLNIGFVRHCWYTRGTKTVGHEQTEHQYKASRCCSRQSKYKWDFLKQNKNRSFLICISYSLTPFYHEWLVRSDAANNKKIIQTNSI